MTSGLDLADPSAVELARLIRAGRASAVEVVDAHLARITERNPSVNAVVAIADDALERAAACDRVIAAGERIGPLQGVPFTAKDIIETVDLPTTLGMPEHARHRAGRDATVVHRMRAAGAILIGKTNCPPGGTGGETDNALHGRTNNPYDLECSPAGSSGGEAAAIASGMSACGLGTDSGGSLRMPAHACGIATLKPTAGRVPVSGILDEEGAFGPMSDPRTQPGPMARRVEDLSLMLAVLAGPDGKDSGAQPVPLADPSAVDLHGLRVALHLGDEQSTPSADVELAARDAGQALTAAGAVLTEHSPPPGGHELTRQVWDSYDEGMTAAELYRILRRWDGYRSTMLGFLNSFDLIVSPVAPGPAVRHGGPISWRYTTPHSLTGWPCVIVRAGSAGVLPLGVQVVAGPWQEQAALAAATAIERALGGWQPPPWPRAP